MKLNAAVKVGLIGGLVIGTCLQLTVYMNFYETTYQFSAPIWLITLFNILGWPLMIVTILAVAPLAIRAAGDAARKWQQAALVGGGAALVATVITYLIAGTPALVVVLGIVPFIVPLSDPASLAGTRVDEVLRPVVQQAVVQVYAFQSASLIGWTAYGALEGAIFALVRPLFARKAKAVVQPQ